MRSLVALAILVAASTGTAHADHKPLLAEGYLQVGAGAGAMGYSCGPLAYDCMDPDVRLGGVQTSVGGMIGMRLPLQSPRWSLRWGVNGNLVGLNAYSENNVHARGTLVTIGPQFGFILDDKLTVDVGAGLSYVGIDAPADNVHVSSATMTFFGSLGLLFTKHIGVYGRADLGAMMEGGAVHASLVGGVTVRI